MAWIRLLRCSVTRDSLLNMPPGLTSVSCADAAEGSPSAKIISNDVATAVGLQSARLPQFKRLRAMTAQGRPRPSETQARRRRSARSFETVATLSSGKTEFVVA
jgi:hypothetical protein